MNTERPDVGQHILDVAGPIILGKGFSAVGLSEILSAADVPKGSFYHYFKSKEGFGEALLDHYFTNYLARVEALLTQPGRPAAERLMQYWRLWLDCQSSANVDGKCMVVKLGAEVSDLSDAMRVALQRGTERLVHCLADCIRAGQDDGSLKRDIDAQLTAQSLYGLWLGASLLSKINRDVAPLLSALRTTEAMLGVPASTD